MSTDAPMSREPQRVMHAMEGLELQGQVVGPKCDADEGQWLCVSHTLMVGNMLQLESHLADDQQHLLVWHCHHHGPEVP
jgi:hypothetical protein